MSPRVLNDLGPEYLLYVYAVFLNVLNSELTLTHFMGFCQVQRCSHKQISWITTDYQSLPKELLCYKLYYELLQEPQLNKE